MRRAIGPIRDHRPADVAPEKASPVTETTAPSSGPVRERIEARLVELAGRVAAGRPVFVSGEQWSPGYGAHQAGTLPDESPRDVLDCGQSEMGRLDMPEPDAPHDDEGGDD